MKSYRNQPEEFIGSTRTRGRKKTVGKLSKGGEGTRPTLVNETGPRSIGVHGDWCRCVREKGTTPDYDVAYLQLSLEESMSAHSALCLKRLRPRDPS